ncbi:MAG: DNA primase [Candidatus Dormibacteraeota bacterium]|nr:DNA primase [Candidatus Dormibacteraeota bacterium]
MPPLRADDAVEQVRARLNLVDVARQHVPLRKQGREWVGLCPFHREKTPSFAVSEQKQSWFCFGCQQGGDIFDFVQRIEKVDFPAALRLLADTAGVELPERAPGERRRTELRRRLVELNDLAGKYYQYVLSSLPAGEPGRRLLREREIEDDVASRFGLGYAPGGSGLSAYLRKRSLSAADAQQAGLVRRDGLDTFQQRLVVPIRDARGNTLAFTGRTILEDEQRKYINTRETEVYSKSRVLFALDLARPVIEERGHAVLMEGQFDVIMGHQRGVGNAVASSGTALSEDQVRLLRRYTDELVLCFDQDAAGRQAAQRATEQAAQHGLRVRVARLPSGAKDPDEYLRSGGRWDDALAQARPGWEHWIREEIADLSPNRPADVEVAVARIHRILARIPQPAVAESVRQEAAIWFGIDPKLLTAPSVQRKPGRATSQGQAAPNSLPDTPVRNDGRSVKPPADRLSGRVAHLVQVLAVRPDAADLVAEKLPLNELEADDREALVRLLDALSEGGVAALRQRLPDFPQEEQNLVWRAWAAAPPRCDDELVRELIERIAQAAASRRRSAIIGRLLEAERRGDEAAVEALSREYAVALSQRQA